ncbi:MAG: cytochrome-c peroxidase [bacterium]|nr:cytochrome-c peroxidase [bacterium]
MIKRDRKTGGHVPFPATVALALALALSLAGLLPACDWFSPGSGATNCADYDFALPPDFAPPPHPAGVCITPERVALGRRLFYEAALSRDANQSCASCHIQKLAFSDGRARSLGSTGATHPRNALALTNAGYFSTLTWFNPEVTRFDNQVLIPLFSENTNTTIEEMAISGMEWVVTRRLQSDDANPSYSQMFVAAFPERGLNAGSAPKDVGRIMHITNVARALAAFQATMVAYRSPYDRGDLSPAASRGRELFESERTGCADCHSGVNLNRDRETQRLNYYNIGLYNVGLQNDYPDQALHGSRAAPRQTQGLHLVTGRPEDRGRFRTPSLRNVAVTGPYMHDGSIETLAEVVAHFNAGGRNIKSGPLAGDGRKNLHKDPRIRPLELSADEERDLVAFLESLTDECFLNDPRFSDPDAPPPEPPAHCRAAPSQP